MAADDPAARAVRAARAYSGMSRAQLAERIGVHPGTIGRYERGDWRKGPPNTAVLEGIARATGILKLFDYMEQVTRGEPDPARRFASAARREAERQGAHRASEATSHSVGDAGDRAP